MDVTFKEKQKQKLSVTNNSLARKTKEEQIPSMNWIVKHFFFVFFFFSLKVLVSQNYFGLINKLIVQMKNF